MARKRMISPEMWESQSFGNLSSPLSKLIFVGLISLADDEGKGILKPQFIKSKLLPYDEKTRITDIEQSIREICAEMSIIPYEVDGKQFYKLTNWSEWQYIKKPSPSKIPNPPMSGVGGDIASAAQVRNEYGTSSPPVRNKDGIEDEEEKEYEKEYEERDARAREVLSSLEAIGCVVDCDISDDLNISALIEKVRQSEYLKEWRFLSKYIAKADKILAGYYDKYKRRVANPMLTREYKEDDMPPMFNVDTEV